MKLELSKKLFSNEQIGMPGIELTFLLVNSTANCS